MNRHYDPYEEEHEYGKITNGEVFIYLDYDNIVINGIKKTLEKEIEEERRIQRDLTKKETRTRAGIKSVETRLYRILMKNFEDDMPKHSIAEYNRLLDHKDYKISIQERQIEVLKIASEECDYWYKSWKRTDALVSRTLSICEEQKRDLERLEKKYNVMEFEIYASNEDEVCAICYDDIKQNQYIHTCDTCKKSIHSHCMLYIEDKSKCPMCRQ